MVKAPQRILLVGAEDAMRTGARARFGNEHGLSLLEAIVATTLLVILITGLLGVFSSAAVGASSARDYEHAVMLAKSRLNELLVIEPLLLNQPINGSFHENAEWEAIAVPVDGFEGDVFGFHLIQVSLDVQVNSDTQFYLEGYRRMKVR